MSEEVRGVVFPTPMPPRNPQEHDPATHLESLRDGAEWIAGVGGKSIAYGVPWPYSANAETRQLQEVERDSRIGKGRLPLMPQFNVELGTTETQDVTAAHVREIYEQYGTDEAIVQYDISSHTASPETIPGTHLFRRGAVKVLGKTIARAAFLAPNKDAHLGLHVGYHWNVDQSLGSSPLKSVVSIINSAMEQWPEGYRRPCYVHIPFGLDRLGRPPRTMSYYQPLSALRMAGTRLAAGIILPPQEATLKAREEATLQAVDLRNFIRPLVPSGIDVAPAFDLSKQSYGDAQEIVRSAGRIARIRKSPPQKRPA